MIDYMEIGSRIRRLRNARGITQEDLAYEIETSAAYISNIERGIKKPSLQKLFDIADVLQVTVNDLIYDESGIISGVTEQNLYTLYKPKVYYRF